MFANDPSPSEVRRVNQELEQRHYEFRSNCHDGEGDASACHSWGEWLSVIDRDYEGAANMYRLNCEKNNYASSCFNLGRLTLSGKGVEMDDKAAFELFEKSCKGGHAQGCHHLGFMLSKGLGHEKDSAKALGAYKEACAHDDANSCNKVASMYLSTVNEDKTIVRDPVQAKKYLERACDANFAPACHNLAVMYKNGDVGVKKDDTKYNMYKERTNTLISQAGGGLMSVKTK